MQFKRVEILIASLLFIAYLYYFFPTQNSEIRIHDTFDGNFTTRHVLIQSGHLFDTNPETTVEGIMNGLPRGVFPRNTEITSMLMFLFGSLNGFAFTFLIVKLLAAIGLFRFVKDHLKSTGEQDGLLLLMSILFACLPFFTIHGLSVAGIPLLLWAFMNIAKKIKIKRSLLTILLFILWSNFILVGVHVLLLLGAISLYLSYQEKKVQWNLFALLIGIMLVYVLSDYMLFYMHYFNKNFESSRTEMEKLLGLNFKGVIGTSINTFFTGDYSTANYFGYLFLPVIPIYFWQIRKNNSQLPSQSLTLCMLLLYLLACIFINLLDWKSFAVFYQKFPLAKIFNFKRFTSLLPGLFFILSTGMILTITRTPQFVFKVLALLIGLSLYVFIWRGNLSYNHSAFDTKGLKIFNEQVVRFDQFFDADAYRQIKTELGAYNGNIIHFGLSPSPSKYFGIKVLDDYQGDYPMTYKLQFRKIIEKELAKSPKLQAYFDNWGSRCYLESANNFEEKLNVVNGILHEPNLEINTEQLQKMNCSYILSGVVIDNAPALHLQLARIIVSAHTQKFYLLYKLT
jgi:hypothetical protein